jgi:hypothetical protein
MIKIISLFRRAPPHELAEPSWDEVLSNADERQAAASYWRGVTTALQAQGNIDPVNCHAILRLVVAYSQCRTRRFARQAATARRRNLPCAACPPGLVMDNLAGYLLAVQRGGCRGNRRSPLSIPAETPMAAPRNV